MSNDVNSAATTKVKSEKLSWIGWLKKKILAVMFGILFAVVLAELALRVIGYSSPTFLRPHAIYGAAYSPGLSGWFRLEGKAWTSINSYGYNDKEWSVKKPANTFRIVVLGDSYTAAQQVERKESFCQQLEENLNRSKAFKPLKVEVLNCGCSGYGTAQELLVWREQASKFEADLVLLAFLPGNDVTDNDLHLDPLFKTTTEVKRPYFEIDADGSLKPNNNFLQESGYTSRTSTRWKIIYWLLDHSRIAQLINTYRISNSAAARGETAQTDSKKQIASNEQTQKPITASKAEVGLSSQVFQEPAGEWITAWKITERLIHELNRDVTSSGSKFAVVSLTSGAQVQPDATKRAEFIETLGVKDLLQAERELARICAAAEPKIPLLTLAEEFQRTASENNISYHGFGNNMNGGHWNQAGHKMAGKMIADWIEKKQIGNPK